MTSIDSNPCSTCATFEFESDFETLDELLLDVGFQVGVVGGQAGEHAEDELLELGA